MCYLGVKKRDMGERTEIFDKFVKMRKPARQFQPSSIFCSPHCASSKKSRHNFRGKIGTPAAVEAMNTPSPMAANVPHTLARKTTTPIAHFLER
mmetsp:Transcript_18134/g.41026  ORF Transcript_18134/g.41026 Transcript_18134/m.41026 type:complete len:94 (-) Transcript_18134:742-1023(-)